MRDLTAAAVILLLVIGCWMWFFFSSGQEIRSLTEEIEVSILPAIEAGEWNRAADLTEEFQKRWNRICRIALYFCGTSALNEIDSSISKAKKYVQARDLSNASGELQAIRSQLSAMLYREKLTLRNIL